MQNKNKTLTIHKNNDKTKIYNKTKIKTKQKVTFQIKLLQNKEHKKKDEKIRSQYLKKILIEK